MSFFWLKKLYKNYINLYTRVIQFRFFCVIHILKKTIIILGKKREVYVMIEKLKIKMIYNDFINNVSLTEEQIKILNMLIKKEKIIKISLEIGVSERTINYEIKKIKKLYDDYYTSQVMKIILLSE